MGSIPITRSTVGSHLAAGRLLDVASRREFLGGLGAAYATSVLGDAANAQAVQLPKRRITGGDFLPIVGLGNTRAFTSGDLPLSRRLIELLLEFGGAYIDTTGPSRFTVARVVRELSAHDDTFVGTYVHDTDTDGASIRADLQAVLAAQGEPRLDLVLTRNVADFAARRAAFRDLKDEGMTRYIGVARHRHEYHRPMMDLIEANAVDFVQVNYSMLEPEAEERLLPMAADHGVAVLTNRPFINGEWFRIVRGRSLPEWASDIDCETWAQFSLKYILSHPAVTCTLTETANPEHAMDNIGGGLGRMPDEAQRRMMRSLVRDLP